LLWTAMGEQWWRKEHHSSSQKSKTSGGVSGSGPLPSIDFVCGEKRTCGEMTGCEEARFNQRQCGVARLDGDGDGVPCEVLCGRDQR